MNIRRDESWRNPQKARNSYMTLSLSEAAVQQGFSDSTEAAGKSEQDEHTPRRIVAKPPESQKFLHDAFSI